MRVDSRRAELARLEEMEVYLSATDYSKPVVKHSASRGGVESVAMSASPRMDKLRGYLLKDIRALEDLKLEAIAVVGLVDDPIQRDVLWEYYIRAAKSWEAAAEALGYSRQHVTRLHGKALQVAREKMRLNESISL